MSRTEPACAGIAWAGPWACPLCTAPLTARPGGALCCPAGHSFDRAREGYWHLLPVQAMRTRVPGDSKEMVAARRAFLSAGYYGAFGAAIAVMIRLFMGTEGVGYSILFANIIACVLDYPGWASARWKKWHIIALPCIVALSLVAVVLVLLFKEGAIA